MVRVWRVCTWYAGWSRGASPAEMRPRRRRLLELGCRAGTALVVMAIIYVIHDTGSNAWTVRLPNLGLNVSACIAIVVLHR